MTPIYVVFPSANAPLASATLSKWKAAGYMTAVLANGPAFDAAIGSADFILREPNYRGWGRSINHLVNLVAGDWIVAAGDDMLPPTELKPWRSRSSARIISAGRLESCSVRAIVGMPA